MDEPEPGPDEQGLQLRGPAHLREPVAQVDGRAALGVGSRRAAGMGGQGGRFGVQVHPAAQVRVAPGHSGKRLRRYAWIRRR